MTDHKCTQKEIIDLKVTGVHSLIQSNADVQNEVNKHIISILERIEAQTTKTNGRVTELENWKWKIIGISIGAAAIIGLIIKVL